MVTKQELCKFYIVFYYQWCKCTRFSISYSVSCIEDQRKNSEGTFWFSNVDRKCRYLLFVLSDSYLFVDKQAMPCLLNNSVLGN